MPDVRGAPQRADAAGEGLLRGARGRRGRRRRRLPVRAPRRVRRARRPRRHRARARAAHHLPRRRAAAQALRRARHARRRAAGRSRRRADGLRYVTYGVLCVCVLSCPRAVNATSTPESIPLAFCNVAALMARRLVGFSNRLKNNFKGVVGTLGNHHVNAVYFFVLNLPRFSRVRYLLQTFHLVDHPCVLDRNSEQCIP